MCCCCCCLCARTARASQAEKFRSKAQKSDTWRVPAQYCRYLFYLGTIRTIQLEYSEAKEVLQQVGPGWAPHTTSQQYCRQYGDCCCCRCARCLHRTIPCQVPAPTPCAVWVTPRWQSSASPASKPVAY